MSFSEGLEGQRLSESGTVPLVPELQRYITTEQLRENVRHYPVMTKELNDQQQRKVGIIREKILEIPLIHATKRPFDTEQDIRPFAELSETVFGSTQGLDRSLGLDQYAFFHWGLPEKSAYGRHFLMVSSDVLLSPNTIVTPSDIGQIWMVDETPYEELTADVRARYERNYFPFMVSGKDWLEITARKVLENVESGQPFYRLQQASTLGEIKHRGPVSGSKILGQFSADTAEMRDQYRLLYEHGISFANMDLAREAFLRTGKRQFVDPSPEECGVDYERASRFWQEALGE